MRAQLRSSAAPWRALRNILRYWKMGTGYILVRVKFPDPVHPEVTPVKFHVPVIVLLFTDP